MQRISMDQDYFNLRSTVQAGQYFSKLTNNDAAAHQRKGTNIIPPPARYENSEEFIQSGVTSPTPTATIQVENGRDSMSNETEAMSESDPDSTRFDVTPTSLRTVDDGDLVNFVMDRNKDLPSTCAAELFDAVAGIQHPIPVPFIPVPQYNVNLPFPDKSGNISAYYGQHPAAHTSPTPPFGAAVDYPTMYISPAGLITVLLKFDIAVELTVEKNIRVVNHRHKAVAATNHRGNTNFVYHVGAKVFHEGSKTEVEVFGERRTRMQVEGVLFSSGMEVYLLDDDHIVPSQFCFNDMSKDSSVGILFDCTSDLLSHEVLLKCEEITKFAKYFANKNGSITIYINDIKIYQDQSGEVHVTSGPKFISTSPVYGSVYLQTHFIEVSVQVNWNVVVKRGQHQLSASYTNFAINNGEHEAGFNQYREVFSRTYNPTASEFESWLPSLTYLSQGLPQSKPRVRYSGRPKANKEKYKGAGDQLSY